MKSTVLIQHEELLRQMEKPEVILFQMNCLSIGVNCWDGSREPTGRRVNGSSVAGGWETPKAP